MHIQIGTESVRPRFKVIAACAVFPRLSHALALSLTLACPQESVTAPRPGRAAPAASAAASTTVFARATLAVAAWSASRARRNHVRHEFGRAGY